MMENDEGVVVLMVMVVMLAWVTSAEIEVSS